MLTVLGQAAGPAGLWGAWVADPLTVGCLLAVAGAYARGWARARRRPPRLRSSAFVAGLLAVAVAVVSPLEVASAELASAHMVQHVLLIAVAAPALALSRPTTTIIGGLPARARVALARVRGRAGVSTRRTRRVWLAPTAWLLHVGTLWLWHGAVPYGAALRSDVVHVVEHTTFLGSALLFWGVVVGSRGAQQVDRGQALLLVFTAGMGSVLLSVLLTFAPTAWYSGYAATTQGWGLTPLADQHLAGVIMWVPASAVYVGAALTLLAAWLRESDPDPSTARPRDPGPLPTP